MRLRTLALTMLLLAPLQPVPAAEAPRAAPAKPAPPAQAGPATDTAGGRPAPLIREIMLQRARITYRGGADAAHQIELDRATLAGLDQGPLRLSLAGRLDGLPLDLGGRLGALADMTGGRPFPVEIGGKAVGLDVSLKGLVRDPAQGTLDLALDLRGKDARGLASFLEGGPQLAATGPVELKAKLIGEQQRYRLADLSGRLGDSALTGTVSFDLAASRPRFEAEIASPRLDLRPFLGDETRETLEQPGDGGDRKPGPVFARDPLPLDGLRAADGRVRVQIARLQTSSVPLQDVRLEATLENGRFRLDPASLTLAGRPTRASVELDAGTAVPSLAVTLDGEALDIGALLQQLKVTGLLEGSGNLQVDLQAQGVSPHDLARSLNGQLSLLMADGRIRTQLLDRVSAGAQTLLGAVAGERAAGATTLRCLAVDVPVRAGVARPDLLLDTDYSVVVGEGAVDLGREEIDLRLTPQAKSRRFGVALPVTISGSLAAPRISVDRTSAALQIGSLLGGKILPPEVLGNLRRMDRGRDNPCLQLAAEPDQIRAPTTLGEEREPEPERQIRAPRGRDDDGESTRDALERAGRGILQDLLRR